MRIRFLGHSCFEIQTKNKILLIDPFITPNSLAQHIDITSLKPDYILITHGHGDHLADAESIGKSNQSTIISNYEIVSWYQAKGVNGHGMNVGGKYGFDFGYVKYVNAVHSSVLPDGSPGGNPGGFVIWNEEGCLYHAGDTALTMDMKLLPITCPAFQMAILPIGDNFTMGYEDASVAADYIDCSLIIGCHFDSFPLIKIDHSAAIATFRKRGKMLIIPSIGEWIEI